MDLDSRIKSISKSFQNNQKRSSKNEVNNSFSLITSSSSSSSIPTPPPPPSSSSSNTSTATSRIQISLYNWIEELLNHENSSFSLNIIEEINEINQQYLSLFDPKQLNSENEKKVRIFLFKLLILSSFHYSLPFFHSFLYLILKTDYYSKKMKSLLYLSLLSLEERNQSYNEEIFEVILSHIQQENYSSIRWLSFTSIQFPFPLLERFINQILKLLNQIENVSNKKNEISEESDERSDESEEESEEENEESVKKQKNNKTEEIDENREEKEEEKEK